MRPQVSPIAIQILLIASGPAAFMTCSAMMAKSSALTSSAGLKVLGWPYCPQPRVRSWPSFTGSRPDVGNRVDQADWAENGLGLWPYRFRHGGSRNREPDSAHLNGNRGGTFN